MIDHKTDNMRAMLALIGERPSPRNLARLIAAAAAGEGALAEEIDNIVDEAEIVRLDDADELRAMRRKEACRE